MHFIIVVGLVACGLGMIRDFRRQGARFDRLTEQERLREWADRPW